MTRLGVEASALISYLFCPLAGLAAPQPLAGFVPLVGDVGFVPLAGFAGFAVLSSIIGAILGFDDEEVFSLSAV